MKQTNLFGEEITENNWKDHWLGMPEFNQEKKEPYAKVIFRFENEDDLNEFSKLINQKLTHKTKSSWYPFKPHRREIKEVYKNE